MSASMGWTMEYILDLDLETFNELLESMLRTEYHQKTEQAWTMMVAAQGDHKAMTNWVGQWAPILRGGISSTKQESASNGNLSEFMDMMGTGF